MSDSPSVPNLALSIFTLRGHKVILDTDLAALYGVPTKALNQAVKRNSDRFPQEFAFLLKPEELAILRSQIVTSSSHGGRRYFPMAFTEHGALMAANVLNSPTAIKMSVALVAAFVRLRQEFITNEILNRRLSDIERTLVQHDSALKELFRAIKPLLLPPPEPPRKKIGFHVK